MRCSPDRLVPDRQPAPPRREAAEAARTLPCKALVIEGNIRPRVFVALVCAGDPKSRFLLFVVGPACDFLNGLSKSGAHHLLEGSISVLNQNGFSVDVVRIVDGHGP